MNIISARNYGDRLSPWLYNRNWKGNNRYRLPQRTCSRLVWATELLFQSRIRLPIQALRTCSRMSLRTTQSQSIHPQPKSLPVEPSKPKEDCHPVVDTNEEVLLETIQILEARLVSQKEQISSLKERLRIQESRNHLVDDLLERVSLMEARNPLVESRELEQVKNRGVSHGSPFFRNRFNFLSSRFSSTSRS